MRVFFLYIKIPLRTLRKPLRTLRLNYILLLTRQINPNQNNKRT